MAEPVVVVVDDETGSRESMAIALERAGWPTKTFDDAQQALEFLEQSDTVRLAICDLRMPGLDGLGFLQAVRERQLEIAVLLVTAFGTIESAVEAMRVGADDYLTKPVDLYELRKRVANLLENKKLKEEVSQLRQMLDKRYGFESLIGRSAPMEHLFEQMRLVAPTRSNVLIIGESGTGKELVASALHRASPRRDERFLAINCGAIPSDILESELFGHERGSFTGAVARKIGKFELAHKGTLFLDEISELYPELQVKLLRVLEDRRIMRVGGSDLLDIDFRLIAATNRDLEKEVESGKFREDLYYRLKVVTLRIPPLRERVADIPLLVEHYLAQFVNEHGKTARRFSPEALAVLRAYPWPGNVRELKNLMESLVIFSHGEVIHIGELPPEMRAAAGARGDLLQLDTGDDVALDELATSTNGMGVGHGGGGFAESNARAAAAAVGVAAPSGHRTMDEIEREAILSTLERTGGRRAEAAQLLGIGLRTLQRKLKDYRALGFFND